MNWRIPLSDIDFGDEERLAVDEVIKSKWLTMGAVTQAFEKEFADYAGVKHAIAVTNCTAALHLACLVVGLSPGDEAIVPSLTFVATANAVRYTGANPVFADITSLENLNISPASIEKRVSPRTRAIVVVHYGGYACDMPKILDIAQKYHLAVIEDAAHAAGSSLDGKALGTWGEVGCFSFFSNKNLTTGEGGMLVTNRDDLAEKLRLFRSHGMTSMTWDRHKGHAWSYDVIVSGYNYRIDEIRSALGRVQLAKLEKNNNLRRHFVDLYGQLLRSQVPEIMIPFRYHPGISSAHIMPILLPEGVNRKVFMDHLKSKGIQTSIHYPPIHTFSAFYDQSFSFDLPLTETAALREVTLPLYPIMTEDNVVEVVDAVKEALAAANSPHL